MRIIKISLLSLIIPVVFLSIPVFAQEAPKADAPVKAAPVVEAQDASDEQSSYVYDLKKLIEKSKDNIKRVNEKIQEQAIYKRNQQREEKAREYYERAIQLFEDGKPQEARDLWEKSVRITEHPEMKNYIRGSEKRFKLQTQALQKEGRDRQVRTAEDQRVREQQVQEAYSKAVALYKQKKFKQSREEFILVEQLIPEFKATRSYLKLLDQNIALQEKDELKNQKKEIARQQEEAEAARVREKETWRKEIELKEQERRAKLMQQAKDVYKQAMDLYAKQDYVGAKEKFQEVEWVIPDYKSTRKYLEKLDVDIKRHEVKFVEQKQKERAKQGWEEEIARKKTDAQRKNEFEAKSKEQHQKDAQEAEMYYQAGIKSLGDKKYEESRDKFLEVQKVYPDYKATSSYLTRVNEKLGIIENAPAVVSDDVKGIYADAVRAYKTKDFAVAKLKFERVEFMYPNYESTRKYLSKLDKDYEIKKSVKAGKNKTLSAEEELLAQVAKPPAPESKVPELSFKSDEKPVSSEEYDQLVKKAEPMYAEALASYEAKKLDESFKQFQAIEEMLPNYKSTRPYLKRVNQQIKRTEQQRYKEEQIQQAETINLLARQANTLFQKIQQLSDDSATNSAKRKFALVDKMFAHMSREQAKLLAEILEEEKRLKLEEIAYEQEVQKSEFANVIDPIYNEAVRLYQAKRYDEAKAKFIEAQSKLADYRSSTRYLALIEKQNLLMQQTLVDREGKIRDYQARAERDAKLAAKAEMQSRDQNMIRELVAQAESINDEIMNLSKDRNFEVIKAKFVELEKVVDNLIMIKNTMAMREQSEHYQEKVAAKGAPEKGPQSAAAKEDNAAAIRRLSTKPEQRTKQIAKATARQQKTFRTKDTENRELYRQAKIDFDQGHYSEAKVKFVALEQQPGYSKASRSYIKSIDQIVLKRQGRVLTQQNQERDSYLKGRVERERQSYRVKEAGISDTVDERARAKALSQGIATSAPYVRNEYLDSLGLRARKSPEPRVISSQTVSTMKEIEPPVASVEKKKVPEYIAKAAQTPEEDLPEGVSPNENADKRKRRQQKALSDKRKKYFEEQYKAAQKEKEEEELKAKEEELARLRTERRLPPTDDKATRRQRARAEKHRAVYEQALRKGQSSGIERAMSAADVEDKKKAEAEIRRQQEALRQQREEEKVERRDKERQIATMIGQGQDVEGTPKTDLSSLRTSKPKKPAQPAVTAEEDIRPTRAPVPNMDLEQTNVRKQFENGVDELYREALGYYKSGMYQEARSKFSDVEDLYPNYKKTRNYMDRTDQEIIKEQKRRVKTKENKVDSVSGRTSTPSRQILTSSAPSGKSEAVASALDMMEAQIK